MPVEIDGKFAFIDKTGKEVIPMNHVEIETLKFSNDGQALVEMDGRRGIINNKGDVKWFD